MPAGDLPLAARMRPASLGEFVGQEHLLGRGSALRTAIEEGRPHSMILYGPPGTGKTTLARLLAVNARAAFEEASAVNAGRAEVREVLARAEHRRQTANEPTIFFLDEIHRFNKAQQDTLLPAVEEGLISLVGATTENPYFEVNSALLSRCRVYELRALEDEHVLELLRRALGDERGIANAPQVEDQALEFLAVRSAGDARSALSALELACETVPQGKAVTVSVAEDALQRSADPLRQGRRQALRPDLGLDQVHARLGPRRLAALSGRDDRGRRGSALHRAAHGRAGERGHRQRRPARARGGGQRRSRGRARRDARMRAQPRPGGGLPRAGAQVERLVQGARPRARVGARARDAAASRRRSRAPPTRARRSSDAARATTTRTTSRRASAIRS